VTLPPRAALSQVRGRRDEGRAEIDAVHLAIEGRGEIAGRSTETRPDVDHRRAAFDPSRLCKLDGRCEATRVKLVEGRQVGWRQPPVCKSGSPQRFVKPLPEIVAAIVLHDLGCFVHRMSSRSKHEM